MKLVGLILRAGKSVRLVNLYESSENNETRKFVQEEASLDAVIVCEEKGEGVMFIFFLNI